jgi:hypothetical protein
MMPLKRFAVGEWRSDTVCMTIPREKHISPKRGWHTATVKTQWKWHR